MSRSARPTRSWTGSTARSASWSSGFPASDHEFRLQAEEEKLGALTVTFHDETNGEHTDEWRKVSTAKPRPDGIPVVLDFNRAINYPSAFTPYGTCPMPVQNNSLDVGSRPARRNPASSKRV